MQRSNHYFQTMKLEHFHQSCSAALRTLREAVFLVFGGVSAQLSRRAGPKTKNPRFAALQLFCQCSNSEVCFQAELIRQPAMLPVNLEPPTV
jgi:hypothetical protein